MPSNVKHKVTNIIMQLISCVSFSVKDHSFGQIPTYKQRFSHSKFPSQLFSTSSMLEGLDCLAYNDLHQTMLGEMVSKLILLITRQRQVLFI
ncbi:protein UPSTREAM OF FLC-like [Dorcoceras hygrometricum]|uniref:Protein UPSTREAM OF FLC-like n=1 Tax=Dorcoceras hygrometricum TaxID=472368 RepID=A0A2Z7BRP3_9LAMI|nr:protein UPSTREAM OF FLC-like [Dorcoceras hygrometricum]